MAKNKKQKEHSKEMYDLGYTQAIKDISNNKIKLKSKIISLKHKHIWREHEFVNEMFCIICGKFKFSRKIKNE